MVRHTAIIGLGSNLGPSISLLHAAWSNLQETPGVEASRLSSPYRSRPVDMDSPHWFVNAVGLIRTSLDPLALLRCLQTIETSFGRRRDPLVSGHQDRPLDLDLLLYDDWHLDSPQLVLPHPRMGERRFVLDPLLEILDGDILSPFAQPLPAWAEVCRCQLGHQAIERLSWPATMPAMTVQSGEQAP